MGVMCTPVVPDTWEDEEGEAKVWGQLGQLSEAFASRTGLEVQLGAPWVLPGPAVVYKFVYRYASFWLLSGRNAEIHKTP